MKAWLANQTKPFKLTFPDWNGYIVGGPTGDQQSRIFKIVESHESLNQIHMTQFFWAAKSDAAWFSLINADTIKRNMGGFAVEMESTSQKVKQMQKSFPSIQFF